MLSQARPVAAFVQEIDCSKYSEDRHSPECDERSQFGVGVLAVGALLVAVIWLFIWRRMLRKTAERTQEADPG